MKKAYGIVISSGKTETLSGGIETPFLYLNDRPVLAYSLMALQKSTLIEGIVVAIPPARAENLLRMVKLFGLSKIKKIVSGGVRRAAAMADALSYVPRETAVTAVLDPSQPLVTPVEIDEVVKTAARYGNAVGASPLPGAVYRLGKKKTFEARAAAAGEGWMVSGPQAYATEKLRTAYPAKTAAAAKAAPADELEMLARSGEDVRMVPMPYPAMRISESEDLRSAVALLPWSGASARE
jgi:2-C-methyl-D-erythritol 4-phosphate cytidylyltransferase